MTSENASNLIEIMYPTRRITERDYITEDADTLVYIFNFENGWTALSGDKRFSHIIGQSETGYLKSSGNSPGIDIWLNTQADKIRVCKVSDEFVDNDNVSFGEHVIPKSKKTSDYYLMNWGYDGQWNDGLYSRSTSSDWYANYKYYKYNVSMYYDIQ